MSIEPAVGENWLPDIFMGLTLHLDNKECQEAGCNAIHELIERRPQMLKGIEHSISLENAVLASLRVYGESDVSVFIASCAAIHSLVVNSGKKSFQIILQKMKTVLHCLFEKVNFFPSFRRVMAKRFRASDSSSGG